MNLILYQLCEKMADLKYDGIMELTREDDDYSFYLGLKTVGKGKCPSEAMGNALIKAIKSEVINNGNNQGMKRAQNQD